MCLRLPLEESCLCIAVAKVMRIKQNPETLTPQYASLLPWSPLPFAFCYGSYGQGDRKPNGSTTVFAASDEIFEGT